MRALLALGNVAPPQRAAYHTRILGMKKILPLVAYLALSLPLLAQSPAPAAVGAPDLPNTHSILDAMIQAGPVMIPLVALSIFAVMLVISYFLSIRKGAIVSSGY